MKFNVTSGKNKGLSFEVLDSEITIGRKKDNQIVIEDEQASGHHAKLFSQGEQVVIEDCGSINGIEVNGKATKKAIIQPGDTIAIGSTKIVAISDEEMIDESADAVSKSTSNKKIDKPKSKSLVKAITAGVLVILVLGAAAVFLFPKQLNLKKRGHTDPAIVNGFFHAYYEKVVASSKNIFRYEVQIENDSLSVNIDDLKQKRQIRQTKKIDVKQIANIRQEIKDQNIFSLEPKSEGKTTDILESYVLKVVMGGESHDVEVINQLPPDSLKRVCSAIEKFVEAELAIPAISQSSDELRKLAQESFLRAKKLYDERFVNAQNLFDSIKAYKETLWYLDSFEPKPSIYADAVHAKQVATEELDQQLKDHEFRAVRAIQLKEWATAREELLTILKKVPDSNDSRNQDAQQRLVDVDVRLKPK